jgi:hypothetical protein
MLETPHVIVGAAIATKLGNPLLAFPLAFMSHFVLEKVPHWNPHLNTETKKYGHPTKQTTIIVTIDAVLALATGTYLASRALPDVGFALTILFSCLFSILPDLIEAPYFFLNMRSKAIKNWIKFQKSLQVDTTPFWGMLTQGITIAAALWWII